MKKGILFRGPEKAPKRLTLRKMRPFTLVLEARKPSSTGRFTRAQKWRRVLKKNYFGTYFNPAEIQERALEWFKVKAREYSVENPYDMVRVRKL